MTLTFLGHVTSSITWPFDTAHAISYRCPIVTKSLSRAVFEITGLKDIGITTLTFHGHVTSSMTSSFDTECAQTDGRTEGRKEKRITWYLASSLRSLGGYNNERIQLKCDTPDFISPDLWPLNSPDLNPVDYKIWGVIVDRSLIDTLLYKLYSSVSMRQGSTQAVPGWHLEWSAAEHWRHCHQWMEKASAGVCSHKRGTFWTFCCSRQFWQLKETVNRHIMGSGSKCFNQVLK